MAIEERPTVAATVRLDDGEPTLVGWETTEQVSSEPAIVVIDLSGLPPVE